MTPEAFTVRSTSIATSLATPWADGRVGGGPAGRAPWPRRRARSVVVNLDGRVLIRRPAMLTCTVVVSIHRPTTVPASAGPIQTCCWQTLRLPDDGTIRWISTAPKSPLSSAAAVMATSGPTSSRAGFVGVEPPDPDPRIDGERRAGGGVGQGMAELVVPSGPTALSCGCSTSGSASRSCLGTGRNFDAGVAMSRDWCGRSLLYRHDNWAEPSRITTVIPSAYRDRGSGRTWLGRPRRVWAASPLL
jgi:hypothetical protein